MTAAEIWDYIQQPGWLYASPPRSELWEVQVFLVDNGRIRLLENGIADYVKELQKKQRKQ